MPAMKQAKVVEQWGLFELTLNGPNKGNPFFDVQFGATFTYGHRTVAVVESVDVYKVRFSPDMQGEWTYRTHCGAARLNGKTGRFTCGKPKRGNHGPVKVFHGTHFAYADGTRYYPFGTTCYAWAHQEPGIIKQTIQTLKTAPFNKMRMCVFPKDYRFSRNEPRLHPFVHVGPGQYDWDLTRFNPAFFRNIEQCVAVLGKLGIEADVILFHPYDRWGYCDMDPATDERYLRYVIARLAAYRNVWWSLANEWDLFKHKAEGDFDRILNIVQACDPYQRLRSNHNCVRLYDHSRPGITHVSFQGHTERTFDILTQYRKPIVVDETRYEGSVGFRWGFLTAKEMTRRFWEGFTLGGYVGHGECHLHDDEIIWWSKGGTLLGDSPDRIGFMRRIMEEGPDQPLSARVSRPIQVLSLEGEYYLFYFNDGQSKWAPVDLPGGPYTAEVIDTWRMTVKRLKGTFSGKFDLPLPGRPYMAARFRKA